MVDQRLAEPFDSAVADRALVDQGVVEARFAAAEQPQHIIRIPARVQHRPAAKARDARQFEAVGAAVRHCNFNGLRKLRRHPLVGIDRQNPVAGRKRQREILLRPKAPPFVLLDPRRRHTVRAAELHEADYTPWEGRDLAAWPSMTMLRGKIVVEDGTFTGNLKDGQFLLRKVPDEIRARPAV